jgi:hypothetical protein
MSGNSRLEYLVNRMLQTSSGFRPILECLSIMISVASHPACATSGGSAHLNSPRLKSIQASADVAIENQAILIPRLPTSVDVAHAHFKEMKKLLHESHRDLTIILQNMKPQVPADSVRSSTARANQEVELKFLQDLTEGITYRQLCRPVRIAWEEWMYSLSLAGQVQLLPGAIAIAPEKAKSIEDQQLRFWRGVKQVQESSSGETGGWDAFQAKTGTFAEARNPDLMRDSTSPMLLAARARLADGVAIARISRTIRNHYAPSLSVAWDPLASYLETSAFELLRYKTEAPKDEDASITSLRLQAEMSLMTQIQSALAFCGDIWALMAQDNARVSTR